MAVGMMVHVPGGTLEAYDKIVELACPDGGLAPGQIFHAAGPDGDAWCVIEVWETREHFDRFFEDRLRPAFQQTGFPMDIHPIAFPVCNMRMR